MTITYPFSTSPWIGDRNSLERPGIWSGAIWGGVIWKYYTPEFEGRICAAGIWLVQVVCAGYCRNRLQLIFGNYRLG
jgi:hypothetical protein